MTAFAVLQNVTHKRTMKNMKTTVLWKGLVVEEDTQKALIQYKEEDAPEHDDIIHELEEILAGSTDDTKRLSVSSNQSIDLALDNFGNPYNMYEVTTTTNRITTRTTQIRPIDAYGYEHKTKKIVEKTNEEEQESFMAVVDPSSQINSCTSNESSVVPFESDVSTMPVKKKGLGFKIMLSSVSKKLSRKKVERQTQYGVITQDTLNETVDGPITTMTSTSTTLQSSYSQRDEKPLPSVPFPDESESDHKSKRRMSWSGMKFNLAKKKSVSNLFQKGVETLSKKRPAPPMPTSPYIHKSNSINSLASLSRTLKTTTYYTTPSKTILRSPSVPAKLHQKNETSPLDSEPNPRNFPRKHIINNIAHFIRYASAAYGESFMRILGIGDIPSVLPNSHHPNHHAFAHHTGVAIQDILLSSYTDTTLLSSVSNSKLHALVHYVTVDHSAQAIVLTCRGTLGLGDVLTDLTCEYKEFTLPTDQLPHAYNLTNDKNQPRQYVAHGGMLEAAQLLAIQKGKVFEAIKKGLEEHPTYGLVLCGHSLGAGVASLLGVLWSEEKGHFLSRHLKDEDLDEFTVAAIKRESSPFVTSELSGLPSGRPIHCYTYGSPCVMSLSLSEYCGQGLVTSVVHAFDIVSSLSLGLLRDFKNVAVSLHEDSHITDEIMNRVIGRYHKKLEEEEEHDQWFWALIKTMRADMREEKLFPPSTTYLIESVPQLAQHSTEASEGSTTSKHKRAHMVQLSRCDDIQARFSEIVFSRTMFMDHSPNMYEKAIKQLNKGFFGGH